MTDFLQTSISSHLPEPLYEAITTNTELADVKMNVDPAYQVTS